MTKVRHNLPSQLTSFVGRERELTELESLAGTCRLVTLTGPGGCGKTRLALELAARLAPTYPSGCYVVSLAAITDLNLVTSTIAETLGVRETTEEPLMETLARGIGARRVLLVLDNFEHLVLAGPMLASLLTACPHLTAIVTSREVLRLQGEQVFPVLPLTLPDLAGAPSSDADIVSIVSASEAGRLFVDRARSAQPAFRLDPLTAPAVSEICVRLDGLPLALELAAARMRLLSPQAMIERLERRLPLLTDGARDLPARQQTLRGTIAWSHDLLEEPERILFRRLAIFVRGCTLEAAEAVGGADDRLGGDPLGVIASLADKSLLRRQDGPGGEPRFGMLETIREYGLEQLRAAGEDIAISRRHLAWFAGFAERGQSGLIGPDGPMWLERLVADHDNIRAALAWSLVDSTGASARTGLRLAGALSQFWVYREYLSEGQRWLQQTLAADQAQRDLGQVGDDATTLAARLGAIGTHPRVVGLNVLSILLGTLGRQEESAACSEAALSLARVVQDRLGEAHALAGLAHFLPSSEYRRMVALLEQSVSLARSLGVPVVTWRSLRTLGRTLVHLGADERGRLALEESLAVARATGGMIWESAHSVRELAVLAQKQGDLDRATRLVEESLALYAQMQATQSRSSALRTRGQLALARGDVWRAAECSIESLGLAYRAGERLTMALCLEDLATVVTTDPSSVSTSSALRAARLLGAAASLRETIGRPVLRLDQPALERTVTAAKITLGEGSFARGWTEGKAMTLEQAVDYALHQDSSLPDQAAAPGKPSPLDLPTAPSATDLRDLPQLTPRETDVVRLIVRGLTNRQIAAHLVISERTASSHVYRILGKLGFGSRAQVAAWAVARGLATPVQPD